MVFISLKSSDALIGPPRQIGKFAFVFSAATLPRGIVAGGALKVENSRTKEFPSTA